MEGPKFPHVRVQLSGRDGNAFTVLGTVMKAMRRAGVPPEEVLAFMTEATAGDYDHLLQTAMATVDIR